MTALSHEEKEAIMKDMKSFDEPMPAVGIFWYDPQRNMCEHRIDWDLGHGWSGDL